MALFGSSETILKIHRDIMENYQGTDKSLKADYPKIIVDMVSVVMDGRIQLGGKSA
ncbi:MAG TPA: hypothetical protein VFI73_13945 [Candidatus Nitrosopolaris sp.]|nr:hypothetical protein [Candidatus Nitrosopolaris sp.]